MTSGAPLSETQLARGVFWITICAFVGLLLGYLFYFDEEPFGARAGAVALLFPPILPIAISKLRDNGFLRAWKNYLLIAIAMVGLSAVVFIFRGWFAPWFLRCAGILDLLLAGLLMILAFFTAGSLFAFAAGKHSDELREIKDKVLTTISLFMALFMCVTYLLAFSLAYWDKAADSSETERILFSNDALYYSREVENDNSQLKILEKGEFSEYCNVTQNVKRFKATDSSGGAASSEESASNFLVLWVNESEESPPIDSKILDSLLMQADNGDPRSLIDLKLGNQGSNRSRELLLQDLSVRLSVMNACTVWEIVKEIGMREGYGRTVIKIESFVTSKQVASKETYQTNLDWAYIRAKRTREVVFESLEKYIEWKKLSFWPEIDWQSVERPRDYRQISLGGLFPKTLSKDAQEALGIDLGRFGPKLTPIRISIRSIPIELPTKTGNYGDLTLLDYFYFMIYTITTTGYGDIIPVKPFSRFVTSFANLCEVFFSLIFFNSLMGLILGARAKQDNEDSSTPNGENREESSS